MLQRYGIRLCHSSTSLVLQRLHRDGHFWPRSKLGTGIKQLVTSSGTVLCFPHVLIFECFELSGFGKVSRNIDASFDLGKGRLKKTIQRSCIPRSQCPHEIMISLVPET